MKHFTNIASALAILSLSQPASAGVREAAFGTSSDRLESRHGMFAGATYRLSLDGRSDQRRGQASLNVAGVSQSPGRAFDLRPDSSWPEARAVRRDCRSAESRRSSFKTAST